MDLRVLEVLNVVYAVLFMFLAARLSTKTILFLLFVYTSLHFAYAAIPILTGAPIEEVIKIHRNGSGLLAHASSIIVLTTTLAVSFFRMNGYLTKDQQLRNYFFLVFTAIVIGFLINFRSDDWLQIRNVVETFRMLTLMVLLVPGQRFNWQTDRIMILSVICLLGLMLLMAFYELFSFQAWASFKDSSGEMIYRASSLLFNPNLYGMWCAILVLGFACLFHCRIGKQWLMLLAMTMAFAGIYLSGSRSAGFLLLFILMAVALLIRRQQYLMRWAPVALMLIVFISIGAGSKWISNTSVNKQTNWHAIALLGERFAAYPAQLGGYLFVRWKALTEAEISPEVEVPPEVALSIEGRFKGEMRDAGWLVLYDDVGWVGAGAVFGLWCLFGWWGLNTYLKKRDVLSVYAGAIWFLSVGMGAVMRFQVFPTSLFIALILAPCLVYWRTSLTDDDAQH